ncbi:MAG: adenosylcobinamide-GDP ribazoletransferase [Chloroflexi bacterium]|nr:adenosylcobinamide-GDP ribazoletransferase [Chloroflexota bacterium]
MALQFLTILPSPLRRQVDGRDLASSVAYFPLVGALLGIAFAGLDALLGLVFPAPVQSALVVVGLILLTGGMHMDGLMDTCDGIFHQSSAARRLEIMRDSRVGAFGVIGAVCVVLLKYAALVALPVPFRLGSLVLMATASRAAMAYCLIAFPYARTEPGLGTLFRGRAGSKDLALGALFTIAVSYLFFAHWGIAMVAVGAPIVWGAAKYISSRILGLTGDTYGAIGEVTEAATLLLALIFLRFGLLYSLAGSA